MFRLIDVAPWQAVHGVQLQMQGDCGVIAEGRFGRPRLVQVFRDHRPWKQLGGGVSIVVAVAGVPDPTVRVGAGVKGDVGEHR